MISWFELLAKNQENEFLNIIFFLGIYLQNILNFNIYIKSL